MLGALVGAGLLSTILFAGEPVPAVDIQTVEQALTPGKAPVIVDVRTPEEFSNGRIPQAVNIPLSQLDQRISELEKSRNSTIYVVCEVGARSASATQTLLDAGFTAPVNVTGGTRAWREAKLPLER